jgi:PPOX class probable F420-dependent enzyme
MPLEIADVITPGQERAFTIGTRTPASSLSALAPAHLALLDGPVTAAVSTLNADGSAQLTPNWVHHDGQHIFLNSVRGRLKDRNLRARPSVSVMLVNPANPYHWITIYGEVEQIIDEDDPAEGQRATASIDDLAEIYLGQRPYPLRDPNGEVRVLYQVRPTRIVTFGSAGGEGA